MGSRERQDRERSAVRESILDAARDLFVNDGYRHVSIRKIAERIEYSPAAIYGYFTSKDEIFLALAEEGFRRLDAKVRSTVADGDAVERVRAGWWAYYEFAKEQPEVLPADVCRSRGAAAVAADWRLANSTTSGCRAGSSRSPPARSRCSPARCSLPCIDSRSLAG